MINLLYYLIIILFYNINKRTENRIGIELLIIIWKENDKNWFGIFFFKIK